MQLQPHYIVDKNNHKIAAQLDIETDNKITSTLENYALAKFIDLNLESDNLTLNDAKVYYKALK
jgi:hypothetical protein